MLTCVLKLLVLSIFPFSQSSDLSQNSFAGINPQSQIFFKPSKAAQPRLKSIGYSNACAAICGNVTTHTSEQKQAVSKVLVGFRHTFNRKSSLTFSQGSLMLKSVQFTYRSALVVSYLPNSIHIPVMRFSRPSLTSLSKSSPPSLTWCAPSARSLRTLRTSSFGMRPLGNPSSVLLVIGIAPLGSGYVLVHTLGIHAPRMPSLAMCAEACPVL